MDVDFAIPLSKDDLLSGEPGSYVVDEVLSVRVLPNILKGTCTMMYTNRNQDISIVLLINYQLFNTFMPRFRLYL